MSINNLFKNLVFQIEGRKILIKDENDFKNYIKQINEKEIDFEKNCPKIKNIFEKEYLKNIERLEEKNIKTFIPLFDFNNYFFYETFSNNIIFTTEPPNELNINKTFNNVFILNKALEKDSELCFELKLGNGLWNNLFYNLIQKNEIRNMNNQINSFKIGLLKLNGENIKQMSEYLTISSSKEIDNKSIWGFNAINYNLNQGKYDTLCTKYENYQKNIFYCVDFNRFVPIIRNNNNNPSDNPKINEFIQKNDVIGIVINNKRIQGFIEVKIFINGILTNCELICKEEENENLSDVDDDYVIEEKKNLKESILVPFIEIGRNRSLFIKDKPKSSNDIDNGIISNEKMEYYNNYNCLPLNHFTDNTFEIQKLTNYYLDILNKVGSKIFNIFPNEIEKYFSKLIIFFNKYAFNNEIIIKNQILYFLSNGINLENGNIEHFKENLKTLFLIIDKYERKDVEKIYIVKLIVNLLIELIIENNFHLINDYELNENNNNEKTQLNNLRKNKFILFFLLFDQYIKEENIIKKIFPQYLFFNDEKIFIIFCFAIFNSCFYNNSIKNINYLKSFFDTQNQFLKKKFLETNFNKSINENNQNDFHKIIIQDYKFIIQYIKENIILNRDKETNYFFKFMMSFMRSEDNTSIINGIIIQLIKNYFEKTSNNLTKNQLEKILFICYINGKTRKLNPYKYENLLFGVYNFDEIKKNHSNLFNNNNFNKKEIKDYLFFDLIVNCISNYYEIFLIKKINAIDTIEFLEKNNNNINYGQNYEINRFNHMIEFYHIIFSGKFYINLVLFANYLMQIIDLCDKNNYLDLLPYRPYLFNILFILDFLHLRCSFIDKKNLIEKNEPKIISSIVKNIFKYTVKFLGKYFSKAHHKKYSSEAEYEEIICLHIKILNKVLMFDVGAIRHALPEVIEDYTILFKNLIEVYDKDKFKRIYNCINLFIDFLYNYEKDKNHIDGEVKKTFFKNIMGKEIEELRKMRNSPEKEKNKYIENTLYFNIFLIIYKRIKIIINSFKEIDKNTNLFNKDFSLEKKYIIKATKIMNILYNFLKGNKLYFFYEIDCISFLKINSFICKIFKVLYSEKNFQKLEKIYQNNNKIIFNFFTQFFFILSTLFLNEENYFEYNYKIAKNRKGFYFNEFNSNFKKYFRNDSFKMMNEILDILLNSFKKICPDNETLNIEEVDDNSIEIDKRDYCPICLELTGDEDVHLCGCNHKYHLNCLKMQISKNFKKCSLCKRDITGIIEDPNFKVGVDFDNHQIQFRSIFEPDINNNNPFLQRDNNSIFIRNNNRSIFDEHSPRNEDRNIFSGRNNNSLFENNQNESLFSSNNNSANSLFGRSEGHSLFGFSDINENSGGGLFSLGVNHHNSLFSNNTGLFGISNTNSEDSYF